MKKRTIVKVLMVSLVLNMVLGGCGLPFGKTTPTPEPVNTQIPILTHVPTDTATPLPTRTPSPTSTPKPTATVTPTATPTPCPHEYELLGSMERTAVCPICGREYTTAVEYIYECVYCKTGKTELKEAAPHVCPTSTPTPTPTATPTPDPVALKDDYVWTTTSVNMRSEANADSKKLTTVAAGTKLHRIGLHENGWCKVELGDYVGFVSGKYVSTKAPTKTPTPKPTATPNPDIREDAWIPFIYGIEPFLGDDGGDYQVVSIAMEEDARSRWTPVIFGLKSEIDTKNISLMYPYSQTSVYYKREYENENGYTNEGYYTCSWIKVGDTDPIKEKYKELCKEYGAEHVTYEVFDVKKSKDKGVIFTDKQSADTILINIIDEKKSYQRSLIYTAGEFKYYLLNDVEANRYEEPLDAPYDLIRNWGMIPYMGWHLVEKDD